MNEDGKHTNGIERKWGKLKDFIGRKKRGYDKISGCLIEEVWRYKHNLWNALLEAIREVKYVSKDGYGNDEILWHEINGAHSSSDSE